MNCPNCGAVVKEGKFCNYCGAKLPDDTKHVEVNIQKKIEDVAEIKRAEYETEESKLRQKKMKKDLRGHKVKWIVCGALLILGYICARQTGGFVMFGLLILIGVPVYIIMEWLHKIL